MNSINLPTPDGILELEQVFGDIHKYVKDDGTLSPDWSEDYLAVAHLPFPIALSWNKKVFITKIQCHKVLVPIFEETFARIMQGNFQSEILDYGGCFNFRPQRVSSKLSCHSWGIAIDINPDTNEMGTSGSMGQDIISIFEDEGFYWGGNFSGKRQDPMHFQFATGY